MIMNRERNKSYFIEMRKHHNNIKRDLYNRYSKNISNLLEIAVGKGGDMDKWVKNGVKNVVGYDINGFNKRG
jgi:ubiquinone/menaquinone biosynthesis C-methylase UbiE